MADDARAVRARSNATCSPSASARNGNTFATSFSHAGASSSGKKMFEMNISGNVMITSRPMPFSASR